MLLGAGWVLLVAACLVLTLQPCANTPALAEYMSAFDEELDFFGGDFTEDGFDAFDSASPGERPDHLQLRSMQPELNQAFIETQAGAGLYKVGDALSGGQGYRLAALLDNAVLLKRAQVYHLLCCSVSDAESTSPAREPQTLIDLRTNRKATEIARRYHSKLYINPLGLLGKVEIKTAQRQNTPEYTIFPGSDPQAFAAFGLQPGDEVLGVNGVSLKDPRALASIFEELASASHVAVTLERAGTEVVVLLSLDDKARGS